MTFEGHLVIDQRELDRALASTEFRDGIRPVADRFVEIAQQHAAVDTGFMRDHIHVEEDAEGTWVISEAEYSVYQEFGTYKMRAHPFMRPALTEVQRLVNRP